ncbi:DivIVA domain-containing protein [Paenibacillus larvae]|uniref:Septum site-determining protein DivIVA n=4 Tax=Paenibacillus larvae TaxID=1464 RepID=V9W5D1_9BACL|nr:DivIVA domain-containing protein [Paenibacillus larvae]AHD06241.1 septum site-determining protein DivIVA [Paenibacillus larvae subsp. larvae DSM 25430]AQR77312.1 DivIVA domain-containing protein [Paenibacillus larvae subsp. larvae]AQT83849.1 DivIVA domain-containing protein [Paenibacillus larvae subsp. pulvifaciens]AQZ45288.1 DivIVA domain-containing protein [Paenibacillus larvae subsp. pulvifaciens]ARF67094.1 DivIVA domain-containing protein [Paenibacillus larvae subsp. pulvifaciens]
MPLTPLDIHNKEFARSFRGYDEDQVNEFLDQIIKDYELLIRDNKELQNQVLALQERLDHFVNLEETLSKTIIVAQETADEVKNNSKKEAQLILKEAEKNADRIINESLAKARKVALETEELKKQASIYRTRFRTLLEAQLEILNDGGWDTLESEIAKLELPVEKANV